MPLDVLPFKTTATFDHQRSIVTSSLSPLMKIVFIMLSSLFLKVKFQVNMKYEVRFTWLPQAKVLLHLDSSQLFLLCSPM